MFPQFYVLSITAPIALLRSSKDFFIAMKIVYKIKRSLGYSDHTELVLEM
jgi:hypothetical protein